MRIIEARKRYGLSAGFRYSNGNLHGAWDIPTPTGTALHADVGGLVRDVFDGVVNNPPGRNPGPGAPSNWVVLHVPYLGGTATVLLNHLSPGLGVRKGQRIDAGAYLGKSGNTGNSSGPHTHVAAFRGDWSGPYRYQYLRDPSLIVWEPDRVLAGGGTGWLFPSGKVMYRRFLRYGGHLQNTDKVSDSIKGLQEVLNRHKLQGGATLPVTGKYLGLTDAEVIKCQKQHGYGNDKPGQSFVGPKQLEHLVGATGCPYKWQ